MARVEVHERGRIVEREAVLAEITQVLEASKSGGRAILLEGLAGEGKSAVVAELRRVRRDDVWVGTCDAYLTPRPLGPLRDISMAVGEMKTALERSHDREDLFEALQHLLIDRSTTLVIEDLQYADAATLDVVLFLGRRIQHTTSGIVLTYRSDALDIDDRLRHVVATVGSQAHTTRIRLDPLSIEGVRSLAEGNPLDIATVHRRTGGNPFYVTEVLAAPGWSVPPSVSDAVHTRVDRLPDDARAVVQTLSVEPAQLRHDTLEALGHDASAITHCLQSGILVATGDAVRFRHEIARDSIYDDLEPRLRRELHGEVLAALIADANPNPSQIAHHAEQSGRDVLMAEWSWRAGSSALAEGSYHEAASHLEKALHACDRARSRPADAPPLADILERLRVAYTALDRPDDVRRVCRRLLDMSDGPEERAIALMNCARAANSPQQSQVLMARAFDEQLAENPAVEARVRMGAGGLAMMQHRHDEAIAHAVRGLRLADTHSLEELRAPLLIIQGTVRVESGDLRGADDLEHAARLASDAGQPAWQATAISNLGSGAAEIGRFDIAAEALDRAIEVAEAHGVTGVARYARAWRARVAFERGHLEDADETASLLDLVPGGSKHAAFVAIPIAIRARVRLGRPTDDFDTDHLWAVAIRSLEPRRRLPLSIALAERFLSGGERPVGVVEETLLEGHDQLVRSGANWRRSEVRFWLGRLTGEAPPRPTDEATAFDLHCEGRLEEAARLFADTGMPFEEAWAMSETTDTHLLRHAVAIFESLGAKPALRRTRSTLASIEGGSAADEPPLTQRQIEVLRLLASGNTNRQIAAHLGISPKTAGHHVSAILSALDVSSRGEATALAYRRGWVESGGTA